MRQLLVATGFSLALLGTVLPGRAGPVSDFEAQLRDAYASYRGALFFTNQKNKQATEAALATFQQKWTALIGQWGKAPPPQYADDTDFLKTLSDVQAVNQAALGEAEAGKLAEAHETLEKIRDTLSALRQRNGVITFSDRMNTYHEVMEVVIGKPYDGFSEAGLRELREDAAVLLHLSRQIEINPLSKPAANADYDAAFRALKGSVEALLAAARAGDAVAAKAALNGLKKPYSQMFLKFG